MDSKIKILIGILVVGIVVIGACWIWNNLSQKTTQQVIQKNRIQGVTITTDKTEYEQGETIKLTVRNNFNKRIWYWAENKCKTPADTVMRAIESGRGKIWLLYFPPQCPQELVKPIYKYLEPGESVILEFKWKNFLTGPVRDGFPLKYKIVMRFFKEKPKEEIEPPEIEFYSNEFKIK